MKSLLISSQLVAILGATLGLACSPSSGTCARDGTSNYISRTLTYDSTAGKFSGSITTNQCNNNLWGRDSSGTLLSAGNHQASCVTVAIPATSYTTTPVAAPLRAAVGYSIYGVNIYGPFEAGFTLGQACDNSLGSCASGLDVGACESKMKYECGASHVKYGMMPDSCGGHANPYHVHFDLACDYNATLSGHSTLVGWALDGRGIYGKYESTGVQPTDLDACGGHYGPVPAITLGGVTYPAASNVYHYHTQDTPPYTVGCFGPVTSINHCKTLYGSTCGTGYTSLTTSDGCATNYDTDCPCFRQGNTTYSNNQFTTCASSTSESSSRLSLSPWTLAAALVCALLLA